MPSIGNSNERRGFGQGSVGYQEMFIGFIEFVEFIALIEFAGFIALRASER